MPNCQLVLIQAALLLLLQLAACTVVPDSASETHLKVAIENAPSERELLAFVQSLPKDCSEERQRLVAQIINRRVGNVGRLLHPSIANETFKQDLFELIRDHRPSIFDIFNTKRSKSNALEVNLLRELATESNQVLLAYKLYNVIGIFAHNQELFVQVIKFLYQRCGYVSLPGYLMGMCLRHGILKHQEVLVRAYIIPLLRPMSPKTEDKFREMSQLWYELTCVLPSLKELYLKPSGSKNCISLKALSPNKHHEIRGQYDMIRVMFQWGFRLDLIVVFSWKGLSRNELRDLAPYMSVDGFWKFLAACLPQKKSELIAVLLQTPPFITQLDANIKNHPLPLFLACQAALRWEANAVLRGLLSIPHAIAYLRKHWNWIESHAHRNFPAFDDEDCLALLNACRRDLEIDGHIVWNLEALRNEMNRL